MTRLKLEKSEWTKCKPGQWCYRRDVHIVCPTCKQPRRLSKHGVHANGEVFPSVVCKNDGCPFHEWVTLEGWDLGEIPETF